MQIEAASGLDSIGVKRYPLVARDLADLSHGLDGAHFVVGVHDRDQGRAVRDGTPDVVWVDQAVVIHRQPGDPKAPFLQLAAGVADGVVFHR